MVMESLRHACTHTPSPLILTRPYRSRLVGPLTLPNPLRHALFHWLERMIRAGWRRTAGALANHLHTLPYWPCLSSRLVL